MLRGEESASTGAAEPLEKTPRHRSIYNLRAGVRRFRCWADRAGGAPPCDALKRSKRAYTSQQSQGAAHGHVWG